MIYLPCQSVKLALAYLFLNRVRDNGRTWICSFGANCCSLNLDKSWFNYKGISPLIFITKIDHLYFSFLIYPSLCQSVKLTHAYLLSNRVAVLDIFHQDISAHQSFPIQPHVNWHRLTCSWIGWLPPGWGMIATLWSVVLVPLVMVFFWTKTWFN